jgi:hypothetical protein
VIADPFAGGAVKLTTASSLPDAALTPVGAPGAPTTTALETADGGPVPSVFVAVTVNVYEVPFVNPVTVSGLADPNAISPPGDAVTVYVLIARPPSEDGGLKLTVACPFPGAAVTSRGAPGAPVGVTAADGADAGPVPTAFTAATVNVYAVPSVSPEIVIGLVAPVSVLPPGEAVTM